MSFTFQFTIWFIDWTEFSSSENFATPQYKQRESMISGMLRLLLLAFVLLCSLSYASGELTTLSKVEGDLMTTLLTNYNKHSRPTTSTNKPVPVKFDLKLGKLVRLDIKSQVMITNTRILMKWFDPSLQWNMTEHNNTDFINIPSSLLWTPDILLYNTAVQQSEGKSDVYKAHVLVRHTGTAIWTSPVTLQASCIIDIKWFPFDKQVCSLNFGSLSYTRNKVKLLFFKQPRDTKELEDNFFFSSGHWSMTGMSAVLKTEKFECCDDPFSVIEYSFKWKRLSTYWLLYLVLPCLCLSFVALFTFFIPPETGERSGFAITTVLAMSVYLLVISDRMPEKSDGSPLIGVLYIVMFFLMTGVLITVIMTTFLWYKTSRPPFWLKRALRLNSNAVVLFNSVNTQLEATATIVGNDKTNENKRSSSTNQVTRPRLESIDERTQLRRRLTLNRSSSRLTVNDMKKMEDNQEEWREIACKLDRVFFWLFLALSIISPGIVLISYSV